MNKLLSLFASGAVALVILMDIVTGQGPPALNGYIGMQPSINYQQQPAIIQRGPPVYPMPARSEYPPQPPQEVLIKEPKEGAYGGEYKHEKEKFYDKEYEKNYEKEEKEKDKGMLSSLSSSVSKAWSNMGRR